MKVLYDRVMLALSYMQGNTAIRNWVQHMMNTINGMVSMAWFSPMSVNSEWLWGEFQVEFETEFTNTTKLQNTEAALKHIRIQQGENINQYIVHFEDLMDKAVWLVTFLGLCRVHFSFSTCWLSLSHHVTNHPSILITWPITWPSHLTTHMTSHMPSSHRLLKTSPALRHLLPDHLRITWYFLT